MQSEVEGGVYRRRGLFSRLAGSLRKSALEREREFYERLRELNAAIEKAPSSITHLVLRGELYQRRGELERARADFDAALAVARGLNEAEGWLIVEQVMRDRALQGLRQVGRAS